MIYFDTNAFGHKEPKTLAGIWKKKGFEKISDLDQEIDNIRKELGTQILERQIQNG